jgi:hypothetical protein
VCRCVRRDEAPHAVPDEHNMVGINLELFDILWLAQKINACLGILKSIAK